MMIKVGKGYVPVGNLIQCYKQLDFLKKEINPLNRSEEELEIIKDILDAIKESIVYYTRDIVENLEEEKI